MCRSANKLDEQRQLAELSLKRCIDCGRILHFDQYYAAATGFAGLRGKCKPCMKVESLAWQANNRHYARAWRVANSERISAEGKRKRAERPEFYRERIRRNNAKRRTKPGEVLRDRISRQMSGALRGQKRGRSFLDLVGWTADELRAHIERQFLKGMSWDNMGKWHIDHIVPLSSFSIEKPEDPDVKRAWALTNLRPMWARDNIAKGAKRLTLL